MPRPIALASGVYRLNVRLPSDLDKLRGSRVILPVDGKQYSIVATDKVAISLRTKDAGIAKARFAEAYAALVLHFEAVRAGPRPLTHKMAVALAGEAYRRRADRLEVDPSSTPEAAAEAMLANDLSFSEWRYGAAAGESYRRRHEPEGPDAAATPAANEGELAEWSFGDGGAGEGEIPLQTARLLVAIQRPSGAELLAWETQADVDTPYASVSLDDALDHLFGADADGLCAEKGLLIDAAGRRLLLREIGKAMHDVARRHARGLEGDYSDDPAAARFPAFASVAPSAPVTAPRKRGAGRSHETVAALFARWRAYHASRRSASTIRRYGPSLAALDRWAAGRDWRSLTDADVFAWATHRNEQDGIAARTVNRNDLVAVASVLAWPTTLGGGKLVATNAAAGVKLDVERKRVKREKMFRAAEAAAILRLARDVTIDTHYPRASASRRWCPWICAYTGARVQETLWLRKKDIAFDEGVWIIDFQETKDGHARRVPVHDALVQEGFIDFVKRAPSSGYLFVGDRAAKAGATRSAQEMRASQLAEWISQKVSLVGVSPNHAWRHTWITLAEKANIPKRFSNRITGHNAGEDASDRYVNGVIELLAAEMRKFPRYRI